MTGSITVCIWHNVTRDEAGRHTGLSGFSVGDQMVKVFTYTTPLHGRTPKAVRRGRVRRVQRRLSRQRGRRAGPPVLRAAAALPVVPRKLTVLQQVVLPSPSRRVGQIVVESAGSGRPAGVGKVQGGGTDDGQDPRSGRCRRLTRPKGSPGVRWWLLSGARWTCPPSPGGT